MKSLPGVKRRSLDVIRVFPSPGDARRGRLVAGGLSIPCALGRGGITRRKREGDGATPAGRLSAEAVLYRADRLGRPRTQLSASAIRTRDGWCDDPGSRLYNAPIRLPAACSHERMWRDDDLYDLVVVLGWNRRPAVRGRGSAIFLHVARPGHAPTEGCVAVRRALIGRLAERIGPRTQVRIG